MPPVRPVIRPAREGDFAEIVALLRLCFADEIAIAGCEDTPESLARLQEAGRRLLVMEAERTIIGFVYLEILRFAASKLCRFPDPKWKGYGEQLMSRAEEVARNELRWKAIHVGVIHMKPWLIRYYENLGYTVLRQAEMSTCPEYKGPQHSVTILSKSLC